MSGFERALFIGRELGGYQGCDGLRIVDFIVLEHGDDPPRLGVSYYRHQDQSIGKIRQVIPSGWDGNLSSLALSSIADICIIFCPSLFENCPSLPSLKELLKDLNEETLWMHESISQSEDGDGGGNKIDHVLLKTLLSDIKNEGRHVLQKLYVCESTHNPKEIFKLNS